MKWFRKWSKARRENRSNLPKRCCISRLTCTHVPHWTSTRTMLSSLCENEIELVDPEHFFQDPEHIRRYKEEEQFLEVMSEWVIVDNPRKHENFFSADFEDELIHLKIQGSSTDGKTEMSHEPECSKWENESNGLQECIRRRFLQRLVCVLRGNKVETGLLYSNISKSDHRFRRKRRKSDARKPSSSGTVSGNVKVSCDFFKSETLTHSFINALEHCASVNRDDEDKHTECDRYDVKQFFRLDDYGNILLNIRHIKETKGLEMKKNVILGYQCTVAKCVSEHIPRRKEWTAVLKGILYSLWALFTGHPRNKMNPIGGPGDSVRCYTLQLAGDHTSTFAQNIENFISCTKESREVAPQVVMRNMRQFMNGMKNYLVKHGEGKFHQEVESARSRLKSDEFLNLDAILETVMHQLVVLPLREHLYGLFVDYYTKSEDIQLLAQNVKYACGRNAGDFGIRPAVAPPTSSALRLISNLLLRLQEAELPLEKLDLFLCVISSIFDATGCPRGQQLGADDFLPILVFVVAKCGFVGAEIEAEFMWGLLQPALLNGEAGYYLTALCSAVHVLKSFMASDTDGTGSLDWRSSSLPASSSVLRVIIPDECNGSLQTRTLPVRPHTTTREVCRIIAHKARITNPQDYALFKLVDGEETLLTDQECPQDIRLAAKGKHCMLAYKRIDAKIAWPTATQPSYS